MTAHRYCLRIIDLGRGEAGVAEEHLHDAEVGALLQQVSGETVPHRVGGDAVADAEAVPGIGKGTAQRPLAEADLYPQVFGAQGGGRVSRQFMVEVQAQW